MAYIGVEFRGANIPEQILSPLPEDTVIIFEHLLCNPPLGLFLAPHIEHCVSLYIMERM